MLRNALTTTLLLAVLVAPALADTLRVPKDFATIQEAVDAAGSGDRIIVSKGSYGPFVVDGASDLEIRGKGKPVIDGDAGRGAGALIELSDCKDVRLDGFVLANGDRGVLVADSLGVTVRRCTISDCGDGVRAWGSTGLLVEKSRFEDVDNGIDLSAEDASPAASEATVRKNRFDRGSTGVDTAGEDHLIEKNRFFEQEGAAVRLDDGTTDVTIAKNRIKNPNTAVRLLGSGHVVEKNRVDGTTNEGIIVEAANCRIEKNRLRKVDDDAIDLEGDDNQILKNVIQSTGDNGIEMDPASGDPYPVTGNLLEKNKISKSGGNGVYIGPDVAGNTLVRNRASKSDGADLFSDAPEEANTFEDNKFKTVEFD